MARICPTCGGEVPPQFRFCGFCGTPLEDSSTGPSLVSEPAEDRSARRLITILFADLTNFTRASERADPETIYLTIRRALERLAHPVKRLGGRIDRYIGDGFLATFGLPEAHEDDPIRAVLAALEMQEAMIKLREEASQSLGWEVELRVGINSGPVISGLLNTGSLLDSTVFGHPVNLTKRLQEAARPGTILVSQLVHRQTHSHFTFLQPVRLNLRGIEGPVVAYEVLGQRALPSSNRGLSGRFTPLVGRASESEALFASLQRLTLERRGAIVLVSGEAGIGKSRLVEETLGRLSENTTVVRAECSPTEPGSYSLLTGVLESMAGVGPDTAPAVRQQRIDGLLSISEPLARDLGAVLRGLVGGRGPDERFTGDPQQQRNALYAAVRQLLAAQARRRPLVLVLDDVQWADPSSLEVLAHAADLVREAPLALVAIVRAPVPAHLPAMLTAPDPARTGVFTGIALGGLSPEESENLVTMLVSEVSLPAALRRSIAERTSGNPLLVEEMVRMLLDHEVIHETQAGWQVEAHWPDAIRQVPDTVNGLILSRYDRLSSWLKRVLDAAAVLGRSFSVSLLTAMTGIDEPGLRPLLASLDAADFIRRSAGAGPPVYFFRHALLQEAIYETILVKERRALHLQAAQAIQAQAQAEPAALGLAALVGHHYERAQSNQAARFLIQAAAQAADRYANQEAIVYYRRVENLLAEHGGTQEQAVDVAVGLSELLARTNRLDEARDQLQRAHTQSQGPPRPGYRWGDIHYRLGYVHAVQGAHTEALQAFETAGKALQEDPEQCRSFGPSAIEREIGWIMSDQANWPEAQRRAQAALALAKQRGDLAAAGSAHNLLAAVHYYSGSLADSVANALEALALREQMGDVWGLASTQSNLGLLYHRLGQWSQAEAFLRQAIFVQQEIGDHNGLGLSLNTLGLLLLDSGRYEEALQGLNQALGALREESQPPSLACLLYLNAGLVWLRLGEVASAVRHLQRGLEAADSLHNDDLRAWALALLAEAQLAGQDLVAAHAFIDQAVAIGLERGSSEARAEIFRVQSRILAAEARWWPALENTQRAAELFKQMGNRYQVACRHVDAAEILLAWNEHDPTVLLDAAVWNQLVEALRAFRELRAEPDVLRAEDLLIKFSARVGPSGAEVLRRGQQPVVIVHLNFELDGGAEAATQPEGAAEVLNALSASLKTVARQHGVVVTPSRSGLVYVMASPETDGADGLAMKAIQCAQAAVEIGLRHNQASRRRYGLDIPLRVGIAAGRWQESLQDEDQVAVYVSVSQTGRQAAAAAALAPPNQIVLTSLAARPARATYELEALEDPKDARLPEPVYRLGRARSDAGLSRPLPASSSELVGRAAERARLTGWVDQLLAEKIGRVCYLEAEAGMGKTRLLEAILAYARPNVVCLHGKCESFRSEISLWPLVDMLEHAPALEASSGRRLKSLLGLRPPDDAEEGLLRSLPPASLRPELFGAVRDYLLQAAQAGPCLLVIEDIHWLDLTSIDLLDYLLPLTLQAPISIMLVARAEMPGPHRALVTKAERVCRSRFLKIAFAGLTEAESQTLVCSLLKSPDLPARLWPALEPFAGHPLSLEEALRFLVERGWLWETDGRWILDDLAGSDRRMPTAFKDLLLGRLDALESETLHVLQAAAVLGESFSRTVLARIVPAPALSGRLVELADRGWLTGAEPENPSLGHFKHTLTRETIYSTLLASKRQVLHQRAGEALEALYPEEEEENLELLAYHFDNTSLRDKALHYIVRAAEKSAGRYALAESLSYYQRARELLDDQPQVMPSVALGLADAHLALGEPASVAADVAPLLQQGPYQLPAELRAGCLRRLGMALRRLGDYQAALEHFQSALTALAGWREAPLALARTLDTTSSELSAIELEIAQTLFAMRDNEAARVQAEQVLSRIDQYQEPELAAETLNLLGGIAYRADDPEGSARLVQQSLALYQSDGNRSGAASAYANLGILAVERQNLEAAHDNLALSLAIHEALGNVSGVAITRNNLGLLARNRGVYAEAIQYLAAAVEAARQAELAPLLTQGLANLGEVQRLAGRNQQARTALEEAEALCRRNDLLDTLCEVLYKRADVLADDGCLDEAEEIAGAAVALAVELDSDDLLSEARRGLARINRRQGRTPEAVSISGAAWRARADDGDGRVRSRFAAEHALALLAAGRSAEAAGLLAVVAEAGLPQESPAVLREITAVLDSGRVRPVAAGIPA